VKVQISAEDEVTMAIVERLVKTYRPDFQIGEKRPIRGSQLQQYAPIFNRAETPMIMLTDLDLCPCPPQLIKDWFKDDVLNPNLVFRVAVAEAETWLMADREGLSRWLGIQPDFIPKSKVIDSKKQIDELTFSYKPSLFLMMELASKSPKTDLKNALIPLKGAKKGPGYNGVMLPFIKSIWDPEEASKNSYSLRKAILRIKEFAPVYF